MDPPNKEGWFTTRLWNILRKSHEAVLHQHEKQSQRMGIPRVEEGDSVHPLKISYVPLFWAAAR